nr:Asp-tRNA(Asn)/Glu-tRNA(Gln) amidotransferase subunit GatC [Arachnia propionica]
MVALTAEEVARLAALARLDLTEAECAELAPELDVILASVSRVGRVAGSDVPLMTHALPLVNVMREDEVRPSLPATAVLAGAPDVEEGCFRVPRILSED